MATGRMLNKSITTDPEFNQMSVDARELYLKTLPHLDRDGLINGHAAQLWATVDPFHADRLQRMGEYIQEWIDANLITRYDTGRNIVLFFKNFRKDNANINYQGERPSAFPPPPGWRRTRAGLVPDDADLRRNMAQDFDPRSTFRAVLLDDEANCDSPTDDEALASDSQATREQLASNSRVTDDHFASNSRVTREKLAPKDQDQSEDQDQAVVVDQTMVSTPFGLCIGGVQGGKSTAITHLLQFPIEDLVDAARQLGPFVFGGDWLGDYEQYIASADESQLVVLVEWLYHLSSSSYDSYEGIKNLPAFVRKCVANGSRPQLTTKRSQDMFAVIRNLRQQEYE